MLTLTITIEGRTHEDLETGLSEVQRQMQFGELSGAETNLQDGNFEFKIEGKAEPVDLPLKKVEKGFVVPTDKGNFIVRYFYDTNKTGQTKEGLEVYSEQGKLLKEIYGERFNEEDKDSVRNIMDVLENDDELL